jgi:hypothetical protein
MLMCSVCGSYYSYIVVVVVFNIIVQCSSISSSVVSTKSLDLTVSGISAGGFFAHQVHVALSSQVTGAGIVAGGPYYCAMNNLVTAQTVCMKDPKLISVDALIEILRNTYATTRTIDSPDNLKSDRVYLFSGKSDTVVVQGVMEKLEELYGRLVIEPGNVVTEFDMNAEHAFPTLSYGNNCMCYFSPALNSFTNQHSRTGTYLGEPYINRCDYDAAYNILRHLIFCDTPMNTTRVRFNETNLIEFQQSKYVPTGIVPREIALDKIGYVYVPKSCRSNDQCYLHVVFHGCLQGQELIGTDFIKHAGYNEYAESNSIVVVYPQVVRTELNPKGCWDWWGYTGPAYASKLGPQIEFVSRIRKYLSW